MRGNGYTCPLQAVANTEPTVGGLSAVKVEDGMSLQVLTIGPVHTLREAARMMADRKIGAAVVVSPDQTGIGILTERDILMSVASGESPDAEVIKTTLGSRAVWRQAVRPSL